MVKQNAWITPLVYILHAYLLDDDQKHWAYYLIVTKMAINSTINASNKKTSFEVLYGEKIPLPIDFLLSKDSFINPQAHNFASKMH